MKVTPNPPPKQIHLLLKHCILEIKDCVGDFTLKLQLWITNEVSVYYVNTVALSLDLYSVEVPGHELHRWYFPISLLALEIYFFSQKTPIKSNVSTIYFFISQKEKKSLTNQLCNV